LKATTSFTFIVLYGTQYQDSQEVGHAPEHDASMYAIVRNDWDQTFGFPASRIVEERIPEHRFGERFKVAARNLGSMNHQSFDISGMLQRIASVDSGSG
jgi:hypothetical protein